MVSLIAKTPCDTRLPLAVGGVEISEVVADTITSVAPFAGQEGNVSDQLKSQVRTPLTPVHQRSGPVLWFGHNQWLVLAAVTLDAAAVTDQTDAWAIVTIVGEDAEAVLARLVPIDLRAAHFTEGQIARTLLGHMHVAISRTGKHAFEIMAMRSMAGTLVHELEIAARGVAARRG
ncbi:sarcosine oxidase subunit gamma [Cognatiyoonia sp. IB215446]|uniref:sarcosine oxidase subunit gamma n=1 Tax=Cognatiyoonia sp. IB215446 TaxID=3097355 RepID=UPI002A15169F|nr:sarcosine oxidase subunit gamma [Cognatiyoonia sp. IB215446]MDX8347699.1 sarcosine oxidase subunit gamma [Cognatiyoonia sp. IB215446]